MAVSTNTIRRFSIYRRLLLPLLRDGRTRICSHEIASLAAVGAAQVRRDLMSLGSTGASGRGYDIQRLVESIGTVLDGDTPQRAALVGLGHLGRAILNHFNGRRPNLAITAAFDVRTDRIDRVILGCRCYHLDALPKVVAEEGITLGILTVTTGAAEDVATRMIEAGILGILNFAPIRLRIPRQVHIENLDMTTFLETVAFFARP